MDLVGTVVAVAEAAAVAAAFWVVKVDASFFSTGIVGGFVFVVEGSSRGRPPANVVKDRHTKQRRNAVWTARTSILVRRDGRATRRRFCESRLILLGINMDEFEYCMINQSIEFQKLLSAAGLTKLS